MSGNIFRIGTALMLGALLNAAMPLRVLAILANRHRDIHFDVHLLEYRGEEIDVDYCVNTVVDYEMQDVQHPIIYFTDSTHFSFTISGINHPVRLILRIGPNRFGTLEPMLAEPGDSLSITLTCRAVTPFIFWGAVRGRGSAKYEFAHELSTVTSRFTETRSAGFAERVRNALGFFSSQCRILDRDFPSISSSDRAVLTADMAGEIFWVPLAHGLDDEKNRISWRPGLSVLDSLQRTLLTANATDLSFSPRYCSFLYWLCKSRLISRHAASDQLDVADVYYDLRASLHGELRDQVLAFCVLKDNDDRQFLNSDMTYKSYQVCLVDASQTIKKASLRSLIKRKLRWGQGATAYSFCLLKDSSASTVCLNQFKGKVVLIDVWSYSCTGCHNFAQEFHREIYSDLKKDTNFVLISIMNGGSEEQYLERLRDKSPDAYTFAEYTNLHDGISSIDSFYHFSAVPFIMLLDKKHNVVSTQLPLLSKSSDSAKIKEVRDLITAALHEDK